MDEREGMAMSSPASFYMHRGFPSTGGWQSGFRGPPQGTRPFNSPNPSMPMQSSCAGGGAGGGGSVSSVQGESPSSISQTVGLNMSIQQDVVTKSEPVKKKSGRPRKYAVDGNVSLGLSSVAKPWDSDSSGALVPISEPESAPTQKRGRGRPPGTGKNQLLAAYGEAFSSSAGMAFTPHVLTISAGEDIAAKIVSFSQQGPRVVCIMSASGSVSAVTIRHSTFGGTFTYEVIIITFHPRLQMPPSGIMAVAQAAAYAFTIIGNFEIVSLSGIYLPSDGQESHSRTGCLSISLSSADGRVIGGGVGGALIAVNEVQVMLGSFIHGRTKSKNKSSKNTSEPCHVEEEHRTEDERTMNPCSSVAPRSNHKLNPVMSGWPGSRPTADVRSLHEDIDLTRG